jgi:PIN domain nuclease of toxin-antitoxin system
LTQLLLDTHAFLWWMEGAGALSAAARAAIKDPATVVYLSAASAWEMSIKRAKGRLDSPTEVVEAVTSNGFRELPVSILHAQGVAELPRHHNDPFGRILIAQARIEGLTIVTRDPAFEAYGVPLLAA